MAVDRVVPRSFNGLLKLLLLLILIVSSVALQPEISVAEGPGAALEFSKPIPMTRGPKHHFYGYYGISPWDSTGKYMLSIETDFHDRMPAPEDAAIIGLIDTETRRFKQVAETRAWNLQQGALQRWLPSAPDSKIIFNDRRDGKLVSVILDVWTGEERVLPHPISNVSADGKKALSLNYARIARLRPVIGYAGLDDPTEGVMHPEDDGVYLMDLETGDVELVVSIADVVSAYQGPEHLSDREIWLSHTGLNPPGTRFYFLVRHANAMGAFRTAMFTADTGGGGLRCVIEFGKGSSHFGWLSDTRLLATMDLHGEGKGSAHVLFDDVENPEYERLGEGQLTVDGHPSFSPDGRWMVTDTYPDGAMKQTLFLMDTKTGSVTELGRLKHSPKYVSQTRCDLHPRWNRDGTAISFDSITKGSRQVYVINLNWGQAVKVH